MQEEKLIDSIKEHYQLELIPFNNEWVIKLYDLEDCTKINLNGTEQNKCVYEDSCSSLLHLLLNAHDFCIKQ